jgi:predicted acetyltransferase
MTEFFTPGLPEVLDDALAIRFCSNSADVEEVVALNALVHGVTESEAVRRWLCDGHPHIRREGWLYVQERSSGRAVATLGLMPLIWRYATASLPVAELGFVATHPDYRRRGLQRVLSATFDRLATANGYTLAAIEGIPYFYRQFGYEYALPLSDSRFVFALELLPPRPADTYRFYPAAKSDVPQLMAFYQKHSHPLAITTVRPQVMWHHYLNLNLASAGSPVPAGELAGLRPYLVQNRGKVSGYVALTPSGWANRLNIVELAADDRETIMSTLAFARNQASELGHEAVGLQLPACHPACQVAGYLGIRPEREYGWQMKVLDVVRFLQTVSPALEERLNGSVLRGHSGSMVIDLYRQRVELSFDAGRVTIRPANVEAEEDVRLPPGVATQLWLGWKPMDALVDWHRDVWVRDEMRLLVDILFPPARAHIYLGY